jgi:FlaA1/EpsC-like NDP-sugar epimerase
VVWTNVLSSQRRWLILCWHILLLTTIYYSCFLLRLDFDVGLNYQLVFLKTLPVLLVIKLTIFSYAGLLQGWWRYAGVGDLIDIVKNSAVSSAFIYITVKLSLYHLGLPRTILLIDLLLTICVLGGLRLSLRVYQETSGRHVPRKNTLIVGAGQAGGRIAGQLKSNPQLDLNPVGYVDDDPSKQGIRIQGIRVLGNISDVPKLVEQNRIGCVLISIPSVNGGKLQSIVERCGKCRVELRILPPIEEHLNGASQISKVRGVRIEDLLGRTPVSLDMDSIRHKLTHKVLMITGAGGSIGSELVRQLAGFEPAKLVLFERAENELHKIDLELHTTHPELECISIVGDILDVRLLHDVMNQHRPNSVFHAAAYKHVPMMERNCFQAVTNNVFGTYNLALVAKHSGVDDFLMISSDKAVRPTNVMGVTKRVAELVILALQHQHTRFVSVRFGNVLGSSGSVLPLFEQQLAHGGPLTVTHVDARRYFMTIPEAVQLVLQASTMGKGGEIFVLDMGSPLKIVDLAKNLVRLSGLDPERDVPIVYTGLRPGEKLFEELHLDAEGIKSTSHPRIRVLDGGLVEFSEIVRWLDDLSGFVEAKNISGLVHKLEEIVPEYTPSPELLASCELDRHDVVSRYRQAQTELLHATYAKTASLDQTQVA